MGAVSQRLENIDALRAIAALAVLSQHLVGNIWRAMPTDPGLLQNLALDFFDWGRFGVILFFLISGYVIPLSFSGPTPMRKFVISRVFRLYPAFWLSVAAMVLVLIVSGHVVDWWQVAANLTLAYPLFGYEALTGIYWTLIVEMLFYLVCFCLFALGLLERPWVIATLALVGIGSAFAPTLAQLVVGRTIPLSMHFYHLAFLFLGCLIRQARGNVSSAKPLAWLVACALLATLPLVTGLVFGLPARFSISLPLGGMAAAIAAVLVFLLSWRPEFKHPPKYLLALGAWSYSIYLLHEPIGDLVSLVLPPETPLLAIAYFLTVTTISIAIAAIVFRFVEKPFIDLGRRLAKGFPLPGLRDRSAI